LHAHHHAQATHPDQRDAQAEAIPQAEVTLEMRKRIGRVRNVVVALAAQKLSIFVDSIIYSYEDSQPYEVKDLVRPEVGAEITARARAACEASGGSGMNF
jgi:hypothetical protein